MGYRYQKRGFVFGYISNFEGMDTGEVVARVVEGRVNKISVVNIDESGKPMRGKGEVSPEVVLREVPIKVILSSCRTWVPGGGFFCIIERFDSSLSETGLWEKAGRLRVSGPSKLLLAWESCDALGEKWIKNGAGGGRRSLWERRAEEKVAVGEETGGVKIGSQEI